ncbi:DNA cytosine methyltransferase [bacterium]|nr:DNA cytosine methyltransferase [bacterium]
MNNYKRYTLQDTLDSEKRALFNVLSTFAGGGGSSTGYRLAGGKILAVNEFVPEAQNTYRENYPNTTIVPGDIKELTGTYLMEQAGVKVSELDILDGSPPCSAFSMAGSVSHGEGRTHADAFGKKKQYSDIKGVENVEDLFFEFLRVAKDIKPKVIIGENVEGLTMGEAKEYFHKIQNTFEDIGYLIVANVLDSSYFGVPQSRKRCFFIGVREDVAEKVGINFMTMYQLYPDKNDFRTTLGEAINDVVNDDKEELDYLFDKISPEKAVGKTLMKMPKDPDKVLTGMDYHDKGHHFNLKRSSLRKPCPTITAMGNLAGVAGTCHPLEDRKFTIKELKRIMSLPEDFKLTGKHKQQSERIGRMVPPLMMKALAESVYNKVLKPYKELNND